MSSPADILQKRLKFKKFVKKDTGRRDIPAVSIPENKSYGCYLNARLARYLTDRGVTAVTVSVDPENEAIAMEPTDDIVEGYRLNRTGIRGYQVNAKLGSVMPCGRYVLVQERSSDELLVFSKEYSTHALMKGVRKNGKN